MIGKGLPPRVAALLDREVSVEELREALALPLTSQEREEILDLSRWFMRRYPTPAERLAYVRQAYSRWQHRAAGPLLLRWRGTRPTNAAQR